MWWIGPLLQLAIFIGYFAFLFMAGPKGRFARLRCALYGHHKWVQGVKTGPGEGEDQGLLIVDVRYRCERCKEVLLSRISFGVEGDSILPIVHLEPYGGQHN